MRKNLKTKIRNLGEIELRFITFDDLVFISNLLDESKDEKSFTMGLLLNQIKSPPVNASEFTKIPEQELARLSRDFVEYEKVTFKYYEETNDKQVFANIKKALTKYLLEVNQGIFSAFQPILEKVNANLYAFKLPDIEIQIQPYVKLGEQIKKIVEPYVKIQKDIGEYFNSIMQKLSSPVRSLSEILSPQTKILNEWSQKYKELLKYQTDFVKSLFDTYKITKTFAFRILRKYKWLVTPSMPAVFVFEVVKIGKRKGNQRKSMNKLFLEHFSRNNYYELERYVDDWKANPLFTPRMKIFRDCINLLKNSNGSLNPSNLILPTLIAQIDAIQREFMVREGLQYKRGWRDKKGKNIDNKEIWFKTKASEKEFGEDYNLASDILFNVLYQGSKLGKPLQIPFSFNRHKIMHGEIIRYGRIDNTLRAFLILDFLSFVTKGSK